MFAEVILPLPLYSSFTYEVPEDMERSICIGSRVIVQFGPRKSYTAIIVGLHHDRPQGYDVKPITCMLDSSPAVRYPQMKLWDWIASYYLCSPGEVFKAALPTSLKPESETYVSLNPDMAIEDISGLTDTQTSVLQVIDSEKRIRLSEIEHKTKIKNIPAVITPLLRKGIVEIAEKVVDRYRPKTEKMVRLTITRNEDTDQNTLHDFFDKVSRSARQEKALVSYLDLSRWLQEQSPLPVTRDELCKASGANPGILKAMADKGIFELYKETVNRFNPSGIATESLPQLSPAQQLAHQQILDSYREKQVTLLHGVTGSGKTEIYVRLIDRVLRDGNQILYLVPEISLTTQLTDRMRRFFGDKLLVYHSKFSDNERVDVWQKLLHSNEPCVVLGARSAVFLPFAHLGLIIVDEEHEASYKQYDPAPRYNARDTAIVLASMHGARTLLGSATPSVETYYKALQGKYGLVTLTERYLNANLPEVEIVNMKEQRKKKITRGILSEPLRIAAEEALKDKKQAIFFQNRRGFSPFVMCSTCGWTPKCVHCDVSLVYHKFSSQLRCHYCGYAIPLPTVCPACEETDIRSFGYGTERIAEEIHEAFPDNSITRMDLDTTRNKDAYQNIIEDFSAHGTDILVGTQMVTKGLDFGNVTLVGVLNADTLLNFPDFRSNERAFNMLEQVAGRAGRRLDKGKVVIQTTDPSNRILSFVKRHDYKAFYDEEIADREKFLYPPFCRIINIYIKNRDQREADEAAILFTKALRNTFGQRVLGPERPFISRVATFYLQQIMLKIEASASMKKVKDILRKIYESLARDPRMKSSIIYYDVDPV